VAADVAFLRRSGYQALVRWKWRARWPSSSGPGGLALGRTCAKGLTPQAYSIHKRAMRDCREKCEAQKTSLTDHAEENQKRWTQSPVPRGIGSLPEAP
jgi:hypothetical protein